MKISFCTTCANRAYQLKECFAPNAETIAEATDAEWIILNYGSADDLDAFVTARLPSASERVIYARVRGPRPWHLSIAKNLAHRFGSGDILVNLDCDNLIGDLLELSRHYFGQGCTVLHHSSGMVGDGTAGRIAMKKNAFYELGGYDEGLFPMGYQDRDLLQRASAAGYPIVHHRCHEDLAIRNSKEDCIRHCRTAGMSWRDFNRLNMERSLANIAAGNLRANRSKGWGGTEADIFRGGATHVRPVVEHSHRIALIPVFA